MHRPTSGALHLSTTLGSAARGGDRRRIEGRISLSVSELQPRCEHGVRLAECVLCRPLPGAGTFRVAEVDQLLGAMALLHWHADPARGMNFDAKVAGSTAASIADPATEPYRREFDRLRYKLRRMAAQARRVVHTGVSDRDAQRRCERCGSFKD